MQQQHQVNTQHFSTNLIVSKESSSNVSYGYASSFPRTFLYTVHPRDVSLCKNLTWTAKPAVTLRELESQRQMFWETAPVYEVCIYVNNTRCSHTISKETFYDDGILGLINMRASLLLLNNISRQCAACDGRYM